MKRRLFMLAAVLIMMVSAVSGCSKGYDLDKAKKLADYEDVVTVLCDSKAQNDVDEFLLLFDYMSGMMRTVVTEDDTFAKVSEGYKDECGDDFTWSYEITEAKKVEEDSLGDYQELVEMFGGDVEITEAYELTIEVEIKGNKGTKENILTLSVGKADDKWQIVNFNDTLLK